MQNYYGPGWGYGPPPQQGYPMPNQTNPYEAGIKFHVKQIEKLEKKQRKIDEEKKKKEHNKGPNIKGIFDNLFLLLALSIPVGALELWIIKGVVLPLWR